MDEVDAMEAAFLALRSLPFDGKVRALTWLMRRFTDDEKRRLDEMTGVWVNTRALSYKETSHGE